VNIINLTYRLCEFMAYLSKTINCFRKHKSYLADLLQECSNELRCVSCVVIIKLKWYKEQYTHIDQTLVNSLIVLLLQQSIEHLSIVYTGNTYFVMHWSM